jgi:FkbM family methyltransferase
MPFNPTNLVGRALRRLGESLLQAGTIHGVWIDVGAHHGERTLGLARHNPGLRIFAIEPNLRAAAKLIGRSANYFVIPVAIAERNDSATFHLNEFDMASSLLPLNEDAVRSWVGVEDHKVESVITVPTMRLDSLMELVGITKVDFLKIDAQGSDLAVLKSAGSRLRDVCKIELEVAIAETPLYVGAPTKGEVVQFLESAGFRLEKTESQTHGQEENLGFINVAS